MFQFFYNIGIRLFVLGMRLASLFHPKARLWCEGRREWAKKLEEWRSKNPGTLVWVHCASLGEFEQGRPLIESIRKQFPEYRILLTFFSPSGYEIRKNYAHADLVFYLPADTVHNAQRFIQIVQPSCAFFVKYEYWANYFFSLKNASIPLYIVSGILRKEQRFFGVFKMDWRRVLGAVSHFFVQNEQTAKLLEDLQFSNVTVTGDTRFDRVVKLASEARDIQEIEVFRANAFCVIGGSTWPQDEAMLAAWHHAMVLQQKIHRLILVPHEIGAGHIQALRKQFPDAVLWSERANSKQNASDVLIIDTIGMLSAIYRYGDVAVIGGGFGKGIHNTLEAAVWGIPVLFGPEHQKFAEALDLLKESGGFAFGNEVELQNLLFDFEKDGQKARVIGQNAGDFVQRNAGATLLIMNKLKQFGQLFSQKN